jgi:chromosomal replication initiator protein
MTSDGTHDPSRLWLTFLAAQSAKLSPHVMSTWMSPVRCTQYDGKTATLEVPDQFSRNWLNDHYLTFIVNGLSEAAGHPVAVTWAINTELGPKRVTSAEAQAASRAAAPPKAKAKPKSRAKAAGEPKATRVPSGVNTVGEERQLNSRYLFDAFVCGPSNQFAFAACRAAAQNPGRSYNPLFIFGGVGLGKTHLLSAIGHRILADNPETKVIYCSSEQFTNEVINAVLGSKLEEFRAKYHSNCDVLLIDDIQLIAGKERTQHEFFHIFNTLYDSHRQIVVTSDKLPHEIPEIEERLRSRFQWGLIADVQPPEIETRIAILRKKAEADALDLPNDVAFFLARSIRTNVRELEGALVRIIAHASLTHTPVTVEFARTTLADILQTQLSEISLEAIQKLVAGYFQIRLSDMKGPRRIRVLVRPRQVAMYLCRKHLGISYPELGQRFGNKDHTTVLSACTRIEEALRTDSALRGQIDDIERRMDTERQG